MFFIILIVSLIAIIVTLVRDSKPKTKSIVIAPFCLLAVFLASFVLIICHTAISGKYYEEKTDEIEIVSLNDNGYVSGHGSRYYVTINSTGGYTFYYKLENGGYVQKTIDASKTVVYQDEACDTPTVTTYTTYSVPVIPMTHKQEMFWYFYVPDRTNSTRYEIHVPKGTIIEEFNLNSQH